MENITGRLIRLFWLLIIAVTGYITWFTFTQWDRAGFLYPLLSAPERVLVIAAGVLLLAVLTGIF